MKMICIKKIGVLKSMIEGREDITTNSSLKNMDNI